MIVTDWQGRHALDAATHQAEFDDLVGRGYRLVKISSYEVDGQPRYASVWYRQEGNPWRALHGVSESRYQEAIEDWGTEGYRPTDLSVLRSGGSTRFNAIWEKETGLEWVARHRLTGAEYQSLFDDLVGRGYRLRCVSPYADEGGERFACIWDRYAGPPWRARHGVLPAEYQSEFDQNVRDGYRLVRSVGYDSGGGLRYATIWEQSPGYASFARHGVSDRAYQPEFDAAVRDDMYLVDVSGCRRGQGATFTTIWEQGQWHPDRRSPAADLIVPFMQKWAAPGFSFAVARNGSRRHAESLGYANRITREAMTPGHRLRIASVSKPITSTAVHMLVEDDQIALSDNVFGTNGILGTKFGTQPYSSRVEQVTVQHLLEHSAGGWANSPADPMFMNITKTLPELISWTLDNVPLTADPGTMYAYSNFGYALLGRIIEQVGGLSYQQFVKQRLLDPSGASQMVLAGRGARERRAAEAMYFALAPDAPYTLPIERMDAHGGWIGSPSNVLQFLARVDTRVPPADLLQAATIADMTTASTVNPVGPGDAGYARGWAVNDVGTIWHDGVLAGTQAILVQVADGRQWCAACTTGRPNSVLAGEFDALMWDVQSTV